MPITISHAKNNTNADWVGVVTVGNSQGSTTTMNASDLVRPVDWNSGHDNTLNISATEISGLFSNAGGVSWGMNVNSITATVATNYMASNLSSNFAGVGETVGTIAGTDLALTMNTDGASIGYAKWITTYVNDLTSGRAGVGETVGTIAGSDLAMTVNTDGVSIGYPKWLTTSTNPAVSAGTQASSTFQTLSFSNANGVSWSTVAGGLVASVVTSYTSTNPAVSAGTQASSTFQTLSFSNANDVSWSTVAGGIVASIVRPAVSAGTQASSTFQTLSFSNANGVSWSTVAGGIVASVVAGGAVVSNALQDVASATGSGTNTSRFAADDHIHRGVGAIAAVGTASTFWGSVHFSAGNNITLSTGGASNAGSIAIHAAAPGGANTFTYCYEPFDLQDGTATLSGSLSQLNIQPFVLQNNISFGQINFIGIGTVPATSASNSHSARLTNSTQRYTFGSSYTIGNTNLVDWFLFSRGAGVSTSELQTFASTRNSFATNYRATYNGGCTLTDTAGGSVSGSQTISMTISYPFLTSYTSTSVAANSTYTGWSSGYTTWTSAANNNSTFTISTSAARTLSIGSTYPATVGWSGAKRINMNFATSLSAGEYWLGYLRHSSSSSSSSSANAFTGAAGTGNSYSATFNHTAYANTMQLTFAGKTATVVNSLGSLGFVTTNNMAVEPGLGSFSGTWASNTTYLNNMGNPAGAIALTQIRSNVSMFRSWFQLASNMPV